MDWEEANWLLTKHIVSICFSFLLSFFKLPCPEKHFPGVLSLLTPEASELLPTKRLRFPCLSKIPCIQHNPSPPRPHENNYSSKSFIQL